jgi:hypothetical protein
MITKNISEKGFSQIEIKVNLLSAGIYTYVLIIDNRTIDVKQMVLTK